MARSRIYPEDIAGTALAVAAHVALVAWLVWMPQPKLPPAPQRVSVTLVGEVGEQSSATSREEAVSAMAPVLSKDPVPQPAPIPVPTPLPQPVPKIAPAPAVRVVQPPVPNVQPRPVPAPVAKPQPVQPKPRQSRLGADFLPSNMSNPAQRSGGASRIGKDFLPGVAGTDAKGKSTTPAGPVITPQLRISFAQSVLRQVRSNWQGQVPEGLNSDKIVSIVQVELNPDGYLARDPVLLGQEGIDDTNRAQAKRHAELAIRAVRRSAPFLLPSDAYEGWKKLPPLRFRKGN